MRRMDRDSVDRHIRRLAEGREDGLLADLRRRTAELPEARMQVSPQQGQLLALLVELLKARNVLEVGVFTGYSSICMARSLPPDGSLVACDISREWTDMAQEYWRRAGLQGRMELRLGPASRSLQQLIAEGREGGFDMAFIDADKSGYADYFASCRRLVRPGGLIALDNAFLGGRALEEEPEEGAPAVVAGLVGRIYADPRLQPVLMPMGDGVLVVRPSGN